MEFKELEKRLADLEQEKKDKEQEIDDIEDEITDVIEKMQAQYGIEKDLKHKELIEDTLNNLRKLGKNIAQLDSVNLECDNCPYLDDCDYLSTPDSPNICNLFKLSKDIYQVFKTDWAYFLTVNKVEYQSEEDGE